MLLYSYRGKEPKPLPKRFFFKDNSTKTSLHELPEKDLEELGFRGPFEKPIVDVKLQKVEWDGEKYIIIDLSDEEKNRIELEEINEVIKNINYADFLNCFKNTRFYIKFRYQSSKSLENSIIYFDFITMLNDTKYKYFDSLRIQKYLNIIFLKYQFNKEDVEEIKSIFKKYNLHHIYNIPEKNDSENYFYDFESNQIIPSSPFKSWKLVDGKWVSPIPYPNTGKNYVWCEDTLNWKLFE